jgi:NAD(P)-dependent dehydrogenase (short-subunit alcohol dehydrogenase family)
MVERRGRIDVLVNAAGSNVRERRLEVLSEADWQAVLGANLSGAFNTVHAVLPTMRRQASGTIVNIISEAGWSATPKAGAAYVASKFGLVGLTQAINLEEQPHGIRATAIYPGDINTPLLDKRPQPPPAEARANMLQAEDVAACVLLAIELPPRAVIEALLVRPRAV